MIRHVVMFTLEPCSENDDCREIALRFKEAIEALPADIPELIDAHVDIDSGRIAGNATLVLTAHLASFDDLEVYAPHPLHLKCVAIIRPYIKGRVCVDAEV